MSSAALLRCLDPQKKYKTFRTGIIALVTAWSLAGLVRSAVASSSVGGVFDVCPNSLLMYWRELTIIAAIGLDSICRYQHFDPNRPVCDLNMDHFWAADGSFHKDWMLLVAELVSSVSFT